MRPRLLPAPPYLDADPAGPAKYPAARALARAAAPPASKLWNTGPVLNQGQLDACIAFSWVALYLAGPGAPAVVSVKAANTYARNYDQRMLLAGGPEIALARGMIDAFWWIDSVDDMRDAVLTIGPVSWGSVWFESMFGTTKAGRIMVKPTPREEADLNLVGGHAITVTGYDADKQLGDYRGPAFRLRNSWGPKWGQQGDGWITRHDMDRLYRMHPDPTRWACVPTGRTSVPVARLLREHPNPRVS